MRTSIPYALPMLVAFCVLAAEGAAGAASDRAALEGFLHYTLAREVREAAERLAETATPEDAEAIRMVTRDWFAYETSVLRARLEQAFGERAKDIFASFMETFLTAEEAGDAAYLHRLAGAVGMRPPPSDFVALRQWALDQWLRDPFAAGSRLLSEIQTWLELRARDRNAPTLDTWIERERTAAVSPPPRQPRHPLAAAEAKAPEWNAVATANGGPLEAFAQKRKERRAVALEQAKAGMAQIAAERQAFETEAAARKLAQAQADAEAMKAQAQKLAAAEEEAMKQRENSWGNRLKRIVGGTLTAATGAFTGGIGTEAGRRAAAEIFK